MERTRDPASLSSQVKVADALKHPNWSMGKKITVDSATLMNKGLEVIEAHYLYGTDYDNIEIVIHPQSIIHSMVETADSSVLAQLGWPDMRLPILYTMSWPERVNTSEETWPRCGASFPPLLCCALGASSSTLIGSLAPSSAFVISARAHNGRDARCFCRLDFIKMGDLTFKKPEHEKYPSMNLAYAAGRAGGTMTGVLSAANEQAVEMFIDEKIGYLDIMKAVEEACEAHRKDFVEAPSLEEIVEYDQWARRFVKEKVEAGAFAPATLA